MDKVCKICNQKYYLETGFYYGAMFISYLVTAFLLFFTFGICFFILNWPANPSTLIPILVVLILYIPINRISRAIWLSFHVSYDENWENQK
jgi:hypothetical protein